MFYWPFYETNDYNQIADQILYVKGMSISQIANVLAESTWGLTLPDLADL